MTNHNYGEIAIINLSDYSQYERSRFLYVYN